LVPGRRALVLLWICFLARGVFYCVALPLWEGFDEYAHFAYVQHIAAGNWLIAPEASANREVEQSIVLAPMPWATRHDPPPHETHEAYWRLPAEERSRRERDLSTLPHSLAAEPASVFLPSESQQPPLSYWVMAAIYRLVAGLSLPARVFALRLWNLLLASAAVPAAAMAARRVFAEDQVGRVALAVGAAVALFPEMMFDGAHVTNSSLAIALFSALTVLILEVVDGRRAAVLWLGAVLGLGLLTKAFFLTVVPVVVAILILAVWKGRTRWPAAAGSLALAAAISMWWYWRNLRITGSFSTALQDAGLRHMPLAERLRHAGDVNWFAALDSTFFSHIWFGGWSFLQLRAWIYHVFAWVAVLAVLGVAVAWFRNWPSRRHLSVLAGIYVLFCVGVAYHVLLTFLVNGVSSSAGWYLCSVIVPEAILAAAGLRALAPRAARDCIIGGVAVGFALLDLYGMIFVALPYYTGLISHKPSGFLEAFHFGPLAAAGFTEVLQHLAVNRPGFIGPAAVAVTGIVYLAATGVLAAISLWTTRRETSS
jgi:4-amino-4-deoxy-L-arabinose transferase-like glycosyltransferase